MIENYVDIHSHIIPGVDDGAQSFDESVSMLEKAYDEGVRTIIATPHYGMKNYNLSRIECEAKVHALNLHIAEAPELAGMKVLLGCEVLYHTGVSDEVRIGSAIALNSSKYVLIEFYDKSDYATLLACVREMKMAGYTPVLAHIERYMCLWDNIERVQMLKNEGALVQVNAGELTDYPAGYECNERSDLALHRNGRPDLSLHRESIVQRMLKTITGVSAKTVHRDELRAKSAWEFVLAGVVDFIASDMHGDIFRVPVMRTALERIAEVAGEDVANQLIVNAQKLFA